MLTKEVNQIQNAYLKGGFRERYAMKNGKRKTIYINGHKCFKYTYSSDVEYQDANGSIYDTETKKWIN